MYLHRIDAHTADILDLDAKVQEAMEPFRLARDLITSIPGLSTTLAEIVIAETGADISVFQTPEQLASWAGTSPGSNESAGRVKSTKTRPGNRYLKGALGIAALSVARTNNTYLSAKYKRITFRRGPAKALVAVEHSMLIAIWHMLTTGELYREPGADYFIRRTPAKIKDRAISQLESLGYTVIIKPLRQTG
jgi:transposase